MYYIFCFVRGCALTTGKIYLLKINSPIGRKYTPSVGYAHTYVVRDFNTRMHINTGRYVHRWNLIFYTGVGPHMKILRKNTRIT